jgi:hypothetical protein
MWSVFPSRVALALATALAVLLGVAEGAAAQGQGDPGEDRVATTFLDTFSRGSLAVDLRYRYEFVDDEAFDRNAHASTLRSALTFETAPLRGIFAGAVLENVTAIGNDTLYDNAGAGRLFNGVRDRPVVVDPALTEVDRVYLGYRGPYGLELRAGRFEVMLDNQRFVGIAPWRQNYRSYDAVSAAIGPASGWRGRYAYLDRVHYNNGSSPGLAGHVVHVSRPLGVGALSAYAYLLDWEAAERASLSSGTFGARLAGSRTWRATDVLYHAEYARQLDHGSNPRDFALDYAHLGVGVRRGAWSLQVAWEMKDGDGTSAVQTPLGTNHGKNGFADRLVVTPPDGSHDRYVRLRMDRERWAWLVAYHDFQAVRGGADLGREMDLQARFSATRSLSFHFKLAHYRADTLSTDTTKVMLWTTLGLDAF